MDESIEKIDDLLESRKRKINESIIKARRSYKPNLLFDQDSNPCSPLGATENSSKIINSQKRLSARKSLSRQVLEQNAFTKAVSTPRMQTRLSLAKQMCNSDKKSSIGIEISHTELGKQFATNIGNSAVGQSSLTEWNMETKSIYTTETNPVTSDQIITHTHNESVNKSSTKITVVDNSDSDISNMSSTSNTDPILTANSDVDESFLVKYVTEKESSQVLSNDTSFLKPVDKNLEEEFEEPEEVMEGIIEEDDGIEGINEDDGIQQNINFETREESNENNEKCIEEQSNTEEVQTFEITDDLSDEDVSFSIQSTLNVETTNVNTSSDQDTNIIEMRSMEPENYIEPNFEEGMSKINNNDY